MLGVFTTLQMLKVGIYDTTLQCAPFDALKKRLKGIMNYDEQEGAERMHRETKA